jgi:hypothetical protein
MMLDQLVLTILPAAFSLMVFSYLYKYNDFFRLAEHTLIGTAAGVEFFVGYKIIVASGIQPTLNGQYIMAPPLLLGLLVFGMFSKRTRYISNWPILIIIAVGLGLAVRGAIYAQLIDQMVATFLPFAGPDLSKDFDAILIAVGTFTSILYFTFTRPHEGALKIMTRTGRYFILVGLGATFGSSVVTFFTPATTPMFWMLSTPGLYLTIIAIVLVCVDIFRNRARKRSSPVA